MLIHGFEQILHPDLRGLFDSLSRPRDVIRRFCPNPPPGGQRSQVVELRLPEGHFFLKVYRYTGLWRLRTLFIVSRARREFLNLHRLSRFGFSTPQPLAYGQERFLGLVGLSYLLTRAVDDAVDLRELCDRPESAPFPLPGPRERISLIRDFALTLRRCHEARLFIHTLFFKNLLLSRKRDRYAVHLIDVPFAGIWRHRILPRQGRIRDLACLLQGAKQLLSPIERLRFAAAYGADRRLLNDVDRYQRRHYP